jgi:hypothetical protein
MPRPATGTRVKGKSPPHRPPDTARESDLGAVRTVRRCAAIPGTVHTLCGMVGGTPWHCAAHSRPFSTLHPSKVDNDALEGRTTTNPAPIQDDAVTQGKRSTSPPSPSALCGHPRRCAAILGTTEPSPTLWGPVLTGQCHAGRCAAQVPPSARPSNQGMDDDQTRAPAGPPSKSPLDWHRSRYDACKGQDSSGQPSNHEYCTLVPRICTKDHAAHL